MREEVEEPNWFARWEDELPTPEELTPLSQSLITPDLALAFDIPTPNNNNNTAAAATNNNSANHHPPPSSSQLHLNHHLPPPSGHQSPDFDSADLASSGGNNGGGDEPARTLKRPRLVWTPQLHKRFVDAVAHLGIKNAVPKTIMQLMSVDGLTRENVASHLQKYRLYLKRMQGLSTGGGGGAGTGGPISAADAATDQLFASGPLPHHFLGRGGVGGVPPAVGGATEPPSFLPYMPVAALQHHHQQMAVAAAAAAQQQYYHQRQHGGLFARGGPGLQMQPGLGRAGPGLHSIMQQQQQQQQMGTGGDVDDLEEGGRGGGRKVLTLFPTGED